MNYSATRSGEQRLPRGVASKAGAQSKGAGDLDGPVVIDGFDRRVKRPFFEGGDSMKDGDQMGS